MCDNKPLDINQNQSGGEDDDIKTPVNDEICTPTNDDTPVNECPGGGGGKLRVEDDDVTPTIEQVAGMGLQVRIYVFSWIENLYYS